MTILYGVAGICFLVICVLASIWIGVYVVLPLLLIGLIVSAVASLVRLFLGHFSDENPHSRHGGRHTIGQNRIIDVEFEEIK